MGGNRSDARTRSVAAFVGAATIGIIPFFVALKILLVFDDIAGGATAKPGPLRLVARIVLALHRDALFILALGALSWLLLRAAEKLPRAERLARLVVLVVYAIAAGWAIGTYFIWQVVHGMLTIDLYRLSGGLLTMDPGVTVALAAVSPWLIASAAAFLGLHAALVRVVPFDRLFADRRRFTIVLAFATTLFVGCTVEFRKSGVDLRESPVAFFAWTWISDPPDFGSGETVTVDETFFAPKPNAPSAKAGTAALGNGVAPARKNVILLVLESVGAKYMHVFGGKWDNTPLLDRMQDQALFFPRAYAHAPMTNESALTLQCSVYPRTGNAPTVGAVSRLRLPDLAGELHQHGYGTAFMCQTLLGWQGQEFFKERHFDVYHEQYEYWRDWGGTRKMDDRELLPKAMQWIDSVRQDKPFFLMMWTYQGHYPCYSVDDPKPYEPQHAPLNRYLNAIREDDRFVGALMNELTSRGLLENTLLVITGDHGQAFTAEASERAQRNLTELAVRVPLVFVNPAITGKTGTDDRLARHIDVAPTILDMLGFDAPTEWQGRSLLGPERTQRVLLTSSYSPPALYGMVDGTMKYITDGKREQLFDLASDPDQRHDLSEDKTEQCRQYHDFLVGWHRYQPTYLDKFVAR